MRKKEKALAKGDQIEFKETPIIAPLSLDDMQSAFWVVTLFSVMALMPFAVELCTIVVNAPKLSKLLTNE